MRMPANFCSTFLRPSTAQGRLSLSTRRLVIVAAVIGLASAGPTATLQAAESRKRTVQTIEADGGMVVSASAEASEAGRRILQQGGNAVDAAVAVAFALEVTWPEAGNIGGGGFMMVAPDDGRDPICVEYRETSPRSVTPTTFDFAENPHT